MDTLVGQFCRQPNSDSNIFDSTNHPQMNPSLASLVYAVGIAGLFYLDRDKSDRTSRALWIPVIWFWITGSRAVSLWLNGGIASADSGQIMEATPTDNIV